MYFDHLQIIEEFVFFKMFFEEERIFIAYKANLLRRVENIDSDAL
jgi:hypothetical protein